MELVDTTDLDSVTHSGVKVQIFPWAQMEYRKNKDNRKANVVVSFGYTLLAKFLCFDLMVFVALFVATLILLSYFLGIANPVSILFTGLLLFLLSIIFGKKYILDIIPLEI